MNEKIPNMLDEELIRDLERLKSLDPEDKEYRDALESIQKLHGMRLDSEKVELDYAAKREKTQLDSGREDEALRLKEAEEKRMQDQALAERKEFWIKLVADAGILVINLAFFAIQYRRGFRFEQTGSLTSSTFKEVRQKAFANMFKRK